LRKFAVVHFDNDFVSCIGICSDYFQAVGIAYDYATELATQTDDGKGTVTPLFDLEGQTGVGLTVRYGQGQELKANIYILDHEKEKEE